MSETEPANPFAQLFEFQRRAVEQSRRAFHQSAEFQKQMNHFVTDGMTSQQNVSRKGTDFARTATEAYIDAMEASVPGDGPAFDQLHGMVRDQFDAMDEMTADTWDAMERAMEENATAYDEFVENYLETVDDAVDVYLDALREAEHRSASTTEGTE